MKHILLENNDTIQNKINAFIKTLITNKNINESFNTDEINIIRDNIINLSEEANYWKEIFQSGAIQKTSDNDNAQDDIIFESECNKIMKMILQQTKDSETVNNSIDKNSKEAQNKQKTAKDKAQAAIDAAKQDANKSTDENIITLIVSNKNYFKFVNNKNQKFESKKSLQKIQSFLQANDNILRDAMANYDAKLSADKTESISNAITFIESFLAKSKTLKPYVGKLNQNILKDILSSFDRDNSIWEKATTRYNFGDNIKNRKKVQTDFFILCGSLMCWYSANFKSGNIKQSEAAKNAQAVSEKEKFNTDNEFKTKKIQQFKNDIIQAIKKCDFMLIAKACDVDNDKDDASLAVNQPLYGWNNGLLARWDIDEQIDSISQVEALQKFLKGEYNIVNKQNYPPHPASIITIIAKLQNSLNKHLQKDKIDQSDVEKFRNAAIQPAKILQSIADKYQNFFPLK